mmetsp:Transcript_2161/g.4968  ORF Transcript_2161/g.4968 Transcript_2161/m.4968 type:complete len:366 (-) Transcript_2161:533-1630(-)
MRSPFMHLAEGRDFSTDSRGGGLVGEARRIAVHEQGRGHLLYDGERRRVVLGEDQETLVANRHARVEEERVLLEEGVVHGSQVGMQLLEDEGNWLAHFLCGRHGSLLGARRLLLACGDVRVVELELDLFLHPRKFLSFRGSISLPLLVELDHHLVCHFTPPALVHHLGATIAVDQQAGPAHELSLLAMAASPRRCVSAGTQKSLDVLGDSKLRVYVEGSSVPQRVRLKVIRREAHAAAPQEPNSIVLIHLEVKHHPGDMGALPLCVEVRGAVGDDTFADPLDLRSKHGVGDCKGVAKVLISLERNDPVVNVVLPVRKLHPVRPPLDMKHIGRPDSSIQSVVSSLTVDESLEDSIVLFVIIVKEVS